ncbi:MAG: hypothetical protein F9K40_05305 [Kofleriaceae bacterium]|nr:MAG: hypothetical protein F9K40_05305 [Kofleriaceae bacterium]
MADAHRERNRGGIGIGNGIGNGNGIDGSCARDRLSAFRTNESHALENHERVVRKFTSFESS